MLQRFLRRASATRADSPPPQGYGSIPTTDGYNNDDDDDPGSLALPTTSPTTRVDLESSWLDLETTTAPLQVPETPSPYAAAGYQRLAFGSPMTSTAAVNDNDSMLEEEAAEQTPLTAPRTRNNNNNNNNSNGNGSITTPTLVLESFQDLAHGISETACQILEGDDQDYSDKQQTNPPPPHHSAAGGQATIASEIATMTKSIVGCGVLSLPGGIAMYSNSSTAVLTAIPWIMLMGAVFGYCCLLLGKICSMTHQSTFRACWEATMGHGTAAVLVSLANACKAGLADLAYSTILSQTVQSLFQTLGYHVTRIQALLLVTLVAILPLCSLQHLHVLAPFSVLGTLGILLTAAAMVVRRYDGSYQPGGRFYDDLPANLQPDLSGDMIWRSQATRLVHMLPFVCMLFESFVMHYNSPRFYAELQRASVPRFALVVAGAFGLSTLIFIVIACAGFETFGGNANGYILNNYSHRDPLATTSRLAIALAILLTYPLAFIGMRDGVMHSLPVSVNVHVLTLVLLGGITLIACVVTDLGIINAVGGGTLAMAIVFVFPALMYGAVIRQKGNLATIGERRQAVLAQVLMGFGVAIGMIGTWLALIHAR